MIAHEEAAKKVHSSAQSFRPVSGFRSGLIGWTFTVAKEGSAVGAVRYSWVTSSGEVSSDVQLSRHEAASIMKAYVKYHPKKKAQ